MPDYPPHPLGSRLLAEVDALVEGLRGPERARFDFDRVASKASVSIIERRLPPGLGGLTLDASRVLINSTQQRAATNFTLAHELAHVYRRRGFFAGLRASEEEWFADWFAREMLLPRAWLDRPWVGQAFISYGVDWLTAALQLAVTGRAPAIMRHGDRVLCRMCGVHHHYWGCECTGLRCGPESTRVRLPEARDVIAHGRLHSRPAQLSMLPNAHPVEISTSSFAALGPR